VKLSTSPSGVTNQYGWDTGLQILADAGFTAIDLSLSDNTIKWDEGIFRDHTDPAFAEHFRQEGDRIRSHGLEIFQSHAPYARPYISDPAYFAAMQPRIIRAIYAAGYLGCPYIVGHPVTHPDFCDGQNRDRARKTTLEYFGALAPALRESGVTMCIENLFYGDLKNRRYLHNFCSDAEELVDIIDTLNETYGPHYAACLDTGHAVVVQNDPIHMLKVLGNRTRVLHLHDNHGSADEHLIPTRGVINWREFAVALGESGYEGTFNFEVFGYYSTLKKDTYSRETLEQACKLLYLMGRSLADIAEGTFVPG